MSEVQPLRFRLTTFDWRRVYLMGVINCTPDSFSDGGELPNDAAAIARGRQLLEAGADLLDIGGESTRPGDRPPVSEEVERGRILPAVAELARVGTVSVDTYKASVAAAAMEAGAEVINDVSGGALEPEILRVVARHGAAIVLGHLRGPPAGMAGRVEFADVVREVVDELSERVARAREAGVPEGRILVDPGLGFGKQAEHNLLLLRHLGALTRLGWPVVVGASRKSFLGTLTGRPVDQREIATAAATTAAVLYGAAVVRVHDVRQQRDAVRVADAIRRSAPDRGEARWV